VQALPQVARIPVLSSTNKGALSRDILQVAERDYLYVLRSIAAQETAKQSALGNRPTATVVDGRRGAPIAEATQSVVVYFADREALAVAIIAARDALLSNGRRVTGRTLGALEFRYSVGRGGAVQAGDPKAIAQSVANPAALDLYVVLPLPHVRKWQWLTRSGERGQRRTRNKILLRDARATKTRAQMVSASVFDTSARQVQARFRTLDVFATYLDTGSATIDRIPAIQVRIRARGRGRNG